MLEEEQLKILAMQLSFPGLTKEDT